MLGNVAFPLRNSSLHFHRVRSRLHIAIGLSAAFIFSAVLASEAFRFAQMASFFLSPFPVSDGQEYFAMARGWLNGLHFYRDLFDIKPPGVSLLAAATIKSGGGYGSYLWCQIVLLAMIGPALGLFVHKSLDQSRGVLRWVAIGLSVLLGISTATWALYRTWGYEPEGFALLFATIPALLFALPTSTRRRDGLDVLAGVSLGIAAMIKEPFAGSGVLALLIFCRSRRDIYRVFRITIIGGIASVVILVLSGSFAAYVSIYLPEAFMGRAVGSKLYPHFGLRFYLAINAPLWLRALDAYKLFTILAMPLRGVLLSAFFGVCVSLWAPLHRNDLRLRTIAISATIVAALLIAGHQFFVLHQLVSSLHSLGKAVPWTNSIIVRLLVSTISPPSLLLLLTVLPGRLRPSWQSCVLAFVTSLGLIAATVLVTFGGDIDARYLVFALPSFLALGVYCIVTLASGRRFLLLGLLASLLIVNAGIPSRFDFDSFGKLRGLWQLAESQKNTAAQLDALLTACNMPRYLLADGSPQLHSLSAFTRHSPYELIYGTYRALGAWNTVLSETGVPNPYLEAKFLRDLEHTPIIIAGEFASLAGDLPMLSPPTEAASPPSPILRMDYPPGQRPEIPVPVATAIRAGFTTNVPPCAAGHVPIPGLQIFFRR